MKFFYYIYIILFLIVCKDDPNPRGDFTKNFLYEHILQLPNINPLEITHVEPKRVNPSFTAKRLVTSSKRQTQTLPAGLLEVEVSFPASFMLIRGKNFDANKYAHSIFINDINVPILYIPSKDSILVGTVVSNTPTITDYTTYSELLEKYDSAKDIMVRVPQGIQTGILKVMKPNGVCNSFDGRSGNGCGTEDVYVDCYNAFQNAFGPENRIEFGKEFKQKYETTDTKAFRLDLEKGTTVINVSCKTIFTFKHFTRSCVAIDTKVKDSTLLYAPTSISVQREPADIPFTLQFQVTAGAGECSITALKEKLY